MVQGKSDETREQDKDSSELRGGDEKRLSTQLQRGREVDLDMEAEKAGLRISFEFWITK